MNDGNFKFNVSSENDSLTIRTGSAPNTYQYAGFRYETHTTDSFCRLLKAKATDIPAAVVFVNDSGFHAVVDTKVEHRPQDSISYQFKYSVLAKEWEPILTDGKAFSVKDMVDFLKRRNDGEIEDIETLLAAAQNFKYAIKIDGDFTRDNNQNYVMAVKVGEAEGTIRVPERIYANVEIYEGSGFLQSIEIEVDIHRPKDERDGKPGFYLSCPKFPRYLDKARRHEINIMELDLKGFLVVRGK